MRKNAGDIFSISIFLVIMLAVWMAFSLLAQPTAVTLEKQSGVVDLSGADFDNTVYQYFDNGWQHYPEALLTPTDFADADVPQESPMSYDDFRTIQYATHRVELRLPPGRIYAVAMKSADYAMRLFVDDEEMGSVGSPGATQESNVPGMARVTYYFQPESDITTILVQSSNWVHREGAFAPNFTVGTAAAIDVRENHTLMMSFLITGVLLTAWLYHLGLFVLYRRRVVTLVFSLCCLLLAVMQTGLSQFFPGMSWYAAFRLEYVVHFLTFAMLCLFLQLLFPRLLHRFVARAYYALAGAYILTTLIFSPKVYSALLIGFQIASMGMIAYVLVSLAVQLKDKERKTQNTLAFVGVALVCLFGVNDLLYTNGVVFLGNIAGQFFTTPIAMCSFVFCYALVVALDYADTERRMKEAQRQVAEAEARIVELAAKSETTARARPEDFGLSERETEVLWLLLDGKARKEVAYIINIGQGTVNTYCERIFKKTKTSGLLQLAKLFGVERPAGEE
jgi:DNA-binding CsgD family transcriptional regulator